MLRLTDVMLEDIMVRLTQQKYTSRCQFLKTIKSETDPKH